MKICTVILDQQFEVHYKTTLETSSCRSLERLWRSSFSAVSCDFVDRVSASRENDPRNHTNNHEIRIFLLPGLIARSPRLQASQSAGTTAGTSSVASETRGTPTSALPP